MIFSENRYPLFGIMLQPFAAGIKARRSLIHRASSSPRKFFTAQVHRALPVRVSTSRSNSAFGTKRMTATANLVPVPAMTTRWPRISAS